MFPTIGRTVGPGGKFFGLCDLIRRTKMKTRSHTRSTEANIVNRVGMH